MLTNTLVICDILDRLGSPNPFSTTSPLELKLSGPKTTESVALEESLRNVVRRFQEMEQKVIEQNSEAAVKRLIQQGQIDRNIGAILLTPPKEATKVETSRPHVAPTQALKSKSISCSYRLY